jgi:phospholipid transport system substrate-binding protein
MLNVIMAVLLASAAVAAGAGPTETVRAAVQQIFPSQSGAPVPAVSTDKRRAEIRQVTESLFNFEEMSRRSLGAHWEQVSRAEKEEFTRLFGNLIANSYMGKIEQYAGEPIQYVSERVDGSEAAVQSRIITPKGSQVNVEYRLYRHGARWSVYDVNVDGISLIGNYRTQFNRIIQRSSFAELLKTLRQKAGS